MKEIKLSRGQVALVDDEDYVQLAGRSWHAAWRPSGFYACQRVDKDGKQARIYMHREIMGLLNSDRRVLVDHINRNPLDNRRANLRITDHKGNGANRGPNKNNTTGHQGICRTRSGKWYVSLNRSGITYRSKSLDTLEDALKQKAVIMESFPQMILENKS